MTRNIAVTPGRQEEILRLDTVLAEIKRLGERLFSDTNEIFSYSAVYSSGNTLESFTLETP